MKINTKHITSLLFEKEDSDSFFEGGKKSKNRDESSGGFECIPKRQKALELKEGEKVRSVLLMMLMAHVTFLACEVFLYNTVVSLIFSDMFYAWLAYFAYMTMSNTAIYGYMVVLGLAAVLGVFQLLSVGGWFLIYIG